MLQAGMSQAETARRLDVARATVHAWSKLGEGPKDQAPSKHPAVRRRLTTNDCNRLRRILESAPQQFDGPARWTLASIAELIQTEFGISYSRSQVSRIVRGVGWDVRRGRPVQADRRKFRAGWQRQALAKLAKLAGLLARSRSTGA